MDNTFCGNKFGNRKDLLKLEMYGEKDWWLGSNELSVLFFSHWWEEPNFNVPLQKISRYHQLVPSTGAHLCWKPDAWHMYFICTQTLLLRLRENGEGFVSLEDIPVKCPVVHWPELLHRMATEWGIHVTDRPLPIDWFCSSPSDAC